MDWLFTFNLENFKVTSTNFANLQVSSTTREFVAAEEDYEYCPNCSRKFFAGRLRLHLKSCKDGKPLKPLKSKPINEQIVKEETALNKTADDVMSYRIPSYQKVDQNASFGASHEETVQETSPQLGSIKISRQEEVYSKQARSTRSPQKEKPDEEDWAGNGDVEEGARHHQVRGEFIDDGIERKKAEVRDFCEVTLRDFQFRMGDLDAWFVEDSLWRREFNNMRKLVKKVRRKEQFSMQRNKEYVSWIYNN